VGKIDSNPKSLDTLGQLPDIEFEQKSDRAAGYPVRLIKVTSISFLLRVLASVIAVLSVVS
jgi:hypothetical protein